MVWKCHAGLLRETLGATPRHSFNEARRKMTEYPVAGYKLTPPTPKLIEARDAMAMSDEQDFAVCASRRPCSPERQSLAAASIPASWHGYA